MAALEGGASRVAVHSYRANGNRRAAFFERPAKTGGPTRVLRGQAYGVGVGEKAPLLTANMNVPAMNMR